MSTFENPDAAPGASAEPETAATAVPPVPPVPEAPAAEAAQSGETAQLDDLTPPAVGHVAEADAGGTSAFADLTPPDATGADAIAEEASGLADIEPPAPAPLPPTFTGFAPAPSAASAPAASVATGAAPATTASISSSGPRTRWAGIVWGLALAAIGSFALWLLTDADRQAAATEWILNLTPAAAIAYSVLVIGAFALVAGLVGLVRRAQRAGERRREASALAP